MNLNSRWPTISSSEVLMIRHFSSSNRFRPMSEELECRSVPASVYQWALVGATNNWDDASNWQIQNQNTWAQAAIAPTSDDTVIFNGTSGRNVNVNVNEIGDVRITSAYTGALLIPDRVTVVCLTMGGGTVRSATAKKAQLHLAFSSNTITAGVIDNTNLRISNISTGASLTIDGDITLSNSATVSIGAPIGNPNELNWASGNIITPANADGSDSSSAILNYGTFRIYSNGQLGVPASAALLRLNNSQVGSYFGTINVYGSPVIAGAFSNSGLLSVRSSANLKIQGAATQNTGTTELRGGTITMTASTGVYAVDAGSLIGNGTIDGNLTLGTVNNGAVSISPGYTGAEAGTLTITKSMHIISTSATTSIQIFNNAGTVTLDKIVVQGGYAILNGTLTVHIAVDYKPDLGTKHTFITAPTFKAPGTTTPTAFATRNLTGQTAYWFPQPGVFRVWRWSPAVDGSYSVHVGDSMS